MRSTSRADWCARWTGLAAWALTVLLALLVPRAAAAADDPALEWSTIETDHFLIHYHSGLEELAIDTARISEEAHDLLSPLLDWEPGQRTHVVLTDVGDSANGSARVVPESVVRLFAATPDIRGALNDYDDWFRSLIYHEYVHILHLDTMSGVAPWLNAIFGRIVAPNGSLPRWYTEGLATYYESVRSDGGRVRHSAFKGNLRTQALDDQFFTLDQITGNMTAHPGVRSWYQHGSHFIAWLAKSFGESALTDFNHVYGGRLIPFGMNIVAKQIFGDDIPTLYQRWQTAELAEALAVWTRVRARGGPTPHTHLSGRTHGHDHPRPRPGHANEVAYLRSDGLSDRRVVIHNLESGEETDLVEAFGAARVAWGPDGTWFIIDEFVPERAYQYHDLFRYDLRSGSKTRLTERARAREPAVSPDGRRVVYSAQRDATSDLVLLDLESGDSEIIHEGTATLRNQHTTPTWFPDNRRIALSYFSGGASGQRDIYVFDVEDRAFVAQLTDDRALDMEPVVHPDGERVAFASDRGGIFDIFMADPRTKDVVRVTNTVGGYHAPAFSLDGRRLFVASAGSQGSDLVEIDFAELESAGLRDANPATRPGGVVAVARLDPEIEVKSYRPWRYLFPGSWLPEVLVNLGFEEILGMTIVGADPVGHHTWLGRVTWNFERDHWGFNLLYAYGGLPVDLQLSLFRGVVARSFEASNRRHTYNEEQVGASIDASMAFPTADQRHTLSAAYNVIRYNVSDPFDVAHDPLGTSPRYPELGWFNSLRLGWSFADVESFNQSVSVEEGFTLGASVNFRNPILGADVSSFDFTWSSTAFLPNPFVDNHVFAFRYAGGLGWGDYDRRGLFVIGGIPEQSLLDAVLNGFGIGGAHLRGYAQAATFGDQFHLTNFEYRFPIVDVERGYETMPIFLGRLSGAAFVDYGAAFFGDFDADKLKLGVGAEVRLRLLMSYALPMMFRFGYAFGVDEPGLHHVYLALGNQF